MSMSLLLPGRSAARSSQCLRSALGIIMGAQDPCWRLHRKAQKGWAGRPSHAQVTIARQAALASWRIDRGLPADGLCFQSGGAGTGERASQRAAIPVDASAALGFHLAPWLQLLRSVGSAPAARALLAALRAGSPSAEDGPNHSTRHLPS